MDLENPIKVITLGELGVGKTSILNQMIFGMMEDTLRKLDVNTWKTIVDDVEYKVEMHDTGGMEKYFPMRKYYYKDAKIVLLVFDFNKRETFDKLKFWDKEMKKYKNNEEYCVFVVGTKYDILNAATTEEEINDFCDDNGYQWAIIPLVQDIACYDINNFFKKAIAKYVRGEYIKKHPSQLWLFNKEKKNKIRNNQCV